MDVKVIIASILLDLYVNKLRSPMRLINKYNKIPNHLISSCFKSYIPAGF